MPEYVFEGLDGQFVERFYKMSEAPKLGECVTIDGQPFTRVPTLPRARVVADRHVASRSLPKYYKHHREAGGKFDDQGRCLFDSMRQIDETMAVAKDNDEGVTYDY
jgi:hypothetical protein